ncbi:penicillin acylase family protein [Craurococcus roseus]|uniref:penicillin acylase family protein n=1 Tax=Craurococcus roseus TaxID=77585 RepID=UPI0031DC6259
MRRVLFGLAAVLLLAAGTAAGLLWWSLPPSHAATRIPGLSAPVEVALDRHGIPRIAAATEQDAAAALGWLHARDRMFPMEMMRRGASGRLAELAGPAMLMNDRFVRTLGLLRRAEADLAILPAETRAVLEAYAAGVNAWIAERGRFAAPEFIPLGAPEPWRPEHSLLWGKVMGLWLSGNWRQELEHARLAAILPPERLSDLWPADDSPGRPDALPAPATAGDGAPPRKDARALPTNSSETITAAPARHRPDGSQRGHGAEDRQRPGPNGQAATDADPAHLSRLLAALPRFPGPGTLPDSASNAWAVSGARSASGAPLLASDPHLGFNAPVLWYLARIDLADGRMMAGATSPGVHGIVIGRTRDLAWGFTTTHSDTQDVFVETPAGPGAYATPDGPRPFTVREETIAVRGGDPVRLRVRETRHGPVISDLDPDGAGGRILAVSMANLAPDDTSAAGLLALNRARTVEEGKAAAALVTGTPQNLMMADAAGGIAMALTGRTPIRRAGDGALPAPGADGSHDWAGWVPFDALPHAEDPPGGALANANNRVSPSGHPVHLGRDWFGDWRFRRIGEMLASRERHDAPNFAAMQRDTVSLLARELATAPDAVLRQSPRPEDAAAAKARDLLLAWDGNIAADRPEPLLFNAWMRAARRLALENGGAPPGAGGPEFLSRVLSPDGRAAAPWCAGDCPALAARALRDAVAELQATEGSDPAAWRWGRVHVARFEHPILRFVPLLGGWTRLQAPTGGDEETVSRGGMRGAGPASWRHVHGAGLRLVADLADPDRTLAVIATGQSAHPLSRHWGDLLPAWRDGGTVSLGRAPADGGEGGRFRLLPTP